MIKEGGDFVVKDAKTGEDLTRSVLTQIIVEQEQKGQNLLPISFLRQLISFYGDSMQFLVPGYLEQAMKAFARNQEQMRRQSAHHLRHVPVRPVRGDRQTEHGDVRARPAHAVARLARNGRRGRTRPGDKRAKRPRRRTRGCAGSRHRSRRCGCSSKHWAAAATKAETLH